MSSESAFERMKPLIQHVARRHGITLGGNTDVQSHSGGAVVDLAKLAAGFADDTVKRELYATFIEGLVKEGHLAECWTEILEGAEAGTAVPSSDNEDEDEPSAKRPRLALTRAKRKKEETRAHGNTRVLVRYTYISCDSNPTWEMCDNAMIEYIREMDPETFRTYCGNHDHAGYKFADMKPEVITNEEDIGKFVAAAEVMKDAGDRVLRFGLGGEELPSYEEWCLEKGYDVHKDIEG